MKTLRRDYCIRMFTGNNAMRPAMMEVHQENGFLYATNAYVCAKIEAEKCVKKYNSVEKYPNVESVIAEHVSVEEKTFSTDDLFGELMKIECCFKPKLIECCECDGVGEKTCDECGSKHDCDECNGRGKVAGDELELSGEYDCNLFNRKYRLGNIDIVLKTAIMLGVDNITISNGKQNKGSIFTVGDFTILVMHVGVYKHS